MAVTKDAVWHFGEVAQPPSESLFSAEESGTDGVTPKG
jgi:hypothetical protein